MDAKHTPTPWHAVKHSWSTTGIYANDSAHGGVIAVLCIEGEATEETQDELEAWMDANAAFIVRAVNSHQLLVAALRVAEESVGDRESLEVVRAAIAKATGSAA